MARIDEHFRLRIPAQTKKWIRDQARENMRSMTAEILFILNERMNGATGEGLRNSAPVASSNNTALQGGASINHG
ncbi:Arc family DNA-binding protein [Brucella sp. 191011898]|uniref:Arc family DNA-binding protein n=1 Tax=Brucella sp. 191011898 TaxID=2730447 RepID=UPI0015DF671C|nr:Arc family DNA-binding protein [Brucella sp. 191011898]CAB4324928.1 hypothetical protein BCH_00142 [Brucella sp. 191011898]